MLSPQLNSVVSETAFLLFLLACFVGGIAAAHKTGADLGVVDHGAIVWDEVVPFWMVLFFCQPGFLWQTTAFLAFRFFDIFKPQPARFFDEMKNGFGVMTDDLVAGGYTLLTLALLGFVLR